MKTAGGPRESSTLVIGLGNPDCGDDGAGRLVAQLLRRRAPHGVRIEEQYGTAATLVDRLCGAGSVILVDAAVTGAALGTIHQIDCTRAGATIPCRSSASSHGLGVAAAIALARILHGLPPACRLYAIEGATFSPGAAMSPAVAAAAAALAAGLAQVLCAR